MTGVGLVEQLLMAGAVATLLLFVLRRWLPQPVGLALGIAAIIAIFSVGPQSISEALMILARGASDAFGVSADNAGSTIGALLKPAETLLQDRVARWAIWAVDGAYWRLIQVFASMAVIACVRQLPLPSAAHRLRATLERNWPTGWRAALSTFLAAVLLAASGLLVFLNVLTIVGIGIGTIAVLVLRLARPQWVSWGTWILAMLLLPPFVLQLFLLKRTFLTGMDNEILIAVTSAISALLVLAGPRREVRSSPWTLLLCLIVFVLPGLGWLAQVSLLR